MHDGRRDSHARRAPAANRLDEEMRRFPEWFNSDAATEPVLKAALPHLWFVTIRPFDDGNGRIARAIAELSAAHVAQGSARWDEYFHVAAPSLFQSAGRIMGGG